METTPPWDRNTSDERHEDSLQTFIIFCEDNNSEPIYFRSFSNDRVQVNAIPNQGQGKLNVTNAIQKCREDGLMEFRDGGWQITEGIKGRIWCVYDRDLEHTNWEEIHDHDHLDFDLIIRTATQSGLQVAWSNDAFELWILLHFEDVPYEQHQHRDYVYGRLTEIFRTLQPRDEALDSITRHPRFRYETSFKRRKHFITHVLPALKANTSAAMTRAEQLARRFNHDIPFHRRNPCTMVHQLMANILQP
jgi:hypothetical protein